MIPEDLLLRVFAEPLHTPDFGQLRSRPGRHREFKRLKGLAIFLPGLALGSFRTPMGKTNHQNPSTPEGPPASHHIRHRQRTWPAT